MKRTNRKAEAARAMSILADRIQADQAKLWEHFRLKRIRMGLPPSPRHPDNRRAKVQP